MKHRWLTHLSIATMLLAFVVYVEPTRVIWGWLRGEAFYQGRPTGYWALRIQPWSATSGTTGMPRAFRNQQCCSETYDYVAVRNPVAAWIGQYVALKEIPWPAVLDGEPDAVRVLNELLEQSEPIVRQWAAEGLHRIAEPATGPSLSVTRIAGRPTRPVPGLSPRPTYRIYGGVGPAAF